MFVESFASPNAFAGHIVQIGQWVVRIPTPALYRIVTGCDMLYITDHLKTYQSLSKTHHRLLTKQNTIVTQHQLMRLFVVKLILSYEQKCQVSSKFLKNSSMLKNKLWHKSMSS